MLQPYQAGCHHRYVTRDRGITVHRRDCPFMQRVPEEREDRLLEAKWSTKDSECNKLEFKYFIVSPTRSCSPSSPPPIWSNNIPACALWMASTFHSSRHLLRTARPNGAGKTTTIEMLEGVHQPTSGTVLTKGTAGVAYREE